jgi:hypothetical protein
MTTVYQEKGNGTFEADGVHYDLNKILRLTANEPIVQVAVSELAWVLEYCNSDPKRVAAADLSAPILVCMYKGQLLTVDGEHRLTKAYQEKVATLPARWVSATVMMMCYVPSRSKHPPRIRDFESNKTPSLESGQPSWIKW